MIFVLVATCAFSVASHRPNNRFETVFVCNRGYMTAVVAGMRIHSTFTYQSELRRWCFRPWEGWLEMGAHYLLWDLGFEIINTV